MSIKLEIGQWDGKSASDIGDIYDRHCHNPLFASEIITLVSDVSLQKGATWLIKRYLESENIIGKPEVSSIFQKLDTIEQWESKLHILQILSYTPIGKSQKKRVEVFLRNCLAENNKFVRAWAYNGFYELAMQYPEHEKETRQFFEMAMRDEAPSVKSRIKNIMKKGF